MIRKLRVIYKERGELSTRYHTHSFLPAGGDKCHMQATINGRASLLVVSFAILSASATDNGDRPKKSLRSSGTASCKMIRAENHQMVSAPSSRSCAHPRTITQPD